MTIVVVFDGQNFFVSPNPAVIQEGDIVEWILWYAGKVRIGSIHWRLRFERYPFPSVAVGSPVIE